MDNKLCPEFNWPLNSSFFLIFFIQLASHQVYTSISVNMCKMAPSVNMCKMAPVVMCILVHSLVESLKKTFKQLFFKIVY